MHRRLVLCHAVQFSDWNASLWSFLPLQWAGGREGSELVLQSYAGFKA
jgi:hypothetical protein